MVFNFIISLVGADGGQSFPLDKMTLVDGTMTTNN